MSNEIRKSAYERKMEREKQVELAWTHIGAFVRCKMCGGEWSPILRDGQLPYRWWLCPHCEGLG